MKSEVLERIDSCKIKLRLEFDQAESQKAYGYVIRQIAKDANIPGFQKGKVPTTMIEQRVGKEQIKGESVNYLLEKNLGKAIEENKFDLLSAPQLENTNLDFENGLQIDLVMELKPEFELTDYKNITVEVPKHQAEAFDEEKELNLLARQFSEYKNVADNQELNQAVEEFDQVIMNSEGKFQDNSPMENANITNQTVKVIKGVFAPGIFEALLGMKAGESKSVDVEFPSDYSDPQFAGKKANYQIIVNEIQRANPVELTEEFIKNNVGFESLDILKAKIKENYDGMTEELNKNRSKLFIINEIVKNIKIKDEIPSWLIERVAQQEADQAHAHEHQAHEDHENCEVKITDEHKENAQRKLKLLFALAKISEENNLELTQEEFYAGAQQFYQLFQMMQMNPEQMDKQALLNLIREQLSMEKTIEWLSKQATINYIDSSEKSNHILKDLEKDFAYLNLRVA